jgi:hypothetical protein
MASALSEGAFRTLVWMGFRSFRDLEFVSVCFASFPRVLQDNKQPKMSKKQPFGRNMCGTVWKGIRFGV